MKRSEGWDIVLQNIKSSLSAKVFLWVLCALTVCSLLIYGIVMIIIPHQYTVLSNSKIDAQIDILSQELEHIDSQSANEKISGFCLENHSAAILVTGNDSVSFGDMDHMTENKDSFTVSLALQFTDCEMPSSLTIVSVSSAASELNRTFLSMLPVIIAIILSVSAISAWLCSRVIVRPVLKISSISKRMAQLDMTWHCNVDRSDELGILANSLNVLALKLTQAMDQLNQTNEQLRQEIETVNAIEKQRRDFFAAASHELKTPITILKGQIESMIFEIGKYKDIKSVLPETLQEVEHMEQLVKEILSISKLEINGLAECSEPIEIHECLQSVIAQLLPLAQEKDIEIHSSIQKASAFGNKALIQKALHNIVSNAVRHSPEKSRFEICLTAEKLTVQNSGIVLPEEEIPHLFTPFYRVEKSRNKMTGGSGLGLYLVKTILELHDFSFSISNGEDCVIFTVNFTDGYSRIRRS